MASNAFGSFQYNLVDVDRLIESHTHLSGTGQGRRGLGHITRSGVVMLCAAWELYLEDVLLEGIRFAIDNTQEVDELPSSVQKELSRFVKGHKHDLKPLQLAGDGWRNVLEDHAINLVNSLNTPKAGPINDLFSRFLGMEELSSCWGIGADAIDDFVTARGDVAHRGRHSDYVQIWQLGNHKDNIYSAAVDTDNYVAVYIRDNFPIQRKPWNAIN